MIRRIYAALMVVSLLGCLSAPLPVDRSKIGRWSVVSADTVRLTLKGLGSPATVRYDERGIPHIEATNDQDLYFLQGYVTASDRLWQMDLFRRVARGELAEIFGNPLLEIDKIHRTYGFSRMADTLVEKLSPPIRTSFEAYTRGVNAFIESRNENNLPPEFRLLQYRPQPWKVTDSMVIVKNFAETLSTTWQKDLMRASFNDLPEEKRAQLLPSISPIDVVIVGSDKKVTPKTAATNPVPVTAPVSNKLLSEAMRITRAIEEVQEQIGFYAQERAASNNWVVNGQHTVTGKPLLANDPHLEPTAPSIWYMTHLNGPGINVMGVTAAGLPGIIIGHNENIVWGITNLGPDVQDLYLETFNKENPRQYKTPTGWMEAEIRHEEIKVRKSLRDLSADTVAFDVTVTRHGPIILTQGEQRYALRWTALDSKIDDTQAFYYINRAENWQQFCEGLSRYPGPTQNFIYADVKGNIGYYGAGLIPIRKSGNGSLPYNGSTDTGEWTGYIPFYELPHVYNPASGIITTANNRIVGLDYPHHLTHEWAAPYRARRIYDLLTAKPKLSIDDFRAILSDVQAIPAANFSHTLAEFSRDFNLKNSDQKWDELVRLFDGWDGRITADSRQALILSEIRTVLSEQILKAALGEERAKAYRWANRGTLLDWVLEKRSPAWLPSEVKSYPELLVKSYQEARARLTSRYGPDETKWVWGARAQVRFPHQLAREPFNAQPFVIEPFPQNGSPSDLATVNVGANVSMRLIADLSDWEKYQQGIGLGQSGDPASPHWKDQLNDWRNVTPRVFPFSKKAVSDATIKVIELAPVQ
ncbi:MAG: penicillin acylase family protein [Acidobacteriota bacterium]